MTAYFSHSQCPSIRRNDRLTKILIQIDNESHRSISGRELFYHTLYVGESFKVNKKQKHRNPEDQIIRLLNILGKHSKFTYTSFLILFIRAGIHKILSE